MKFEIKSDLNSELANELEKELKERGHTVKRNSNVIQDIVGDIFAGIEKGADIVVSIKQGKSDKEAKNTKVFKED